MNKKLIESVWSGAAQIAASKLLDLWQINNNKSIANIQDYRQVRWLQYKTRIDLQGAKLILTTDQAGVGSTAVSNVVTQPIFTNQIDVGIDLTKIYGINQINKLITLNKGYAVTRIAGTKVFFDDFVPANITTPWRYSNTVKATIDLEDAGVSTGDSLFIRIYRGSRHFDIETKITGVAGNKAGFVWSKTTLEPGLPKSSIDIGDQINAAKALGISLELDKEGNPVYKDEALKIYNELNSIQWKRENYEKELTIVTVLGESVVLEPLYINRQSRVKIDSKVRAIPSLQEYIQQPEFYIDNDKYYRIDNNIEISKPIILNENKDYVIITTDGLPVTVNTMANSNKVQLPYSSLDKFKIEIGDLLVITKGLNAGTFTITSILNTEEVLLSEALTTTEVGAEGTIQKRISNSWLVFSDKGPKPDLWAETTFIDNYNIIENNFGTVVGLTYNDFKSQRLPFSYKTAVAGLMYALTSGPQVDSIKLSATVLLGLPFTYNAGVITEIEKEYRLNPTTGAPEFGRIVVSRENGTEDVYYYPRGKQIKVNGNWTDVSTTLSGIAINPNTGSEYVIGDSIAKYAVLTKGIDVADYSTNDRWLSSVASQYNNISKYHTFYIRANSDMYGIASLTFLANYINKIKPTYTSIKTVATQEQKDTVTVTDSLFMRVALRQFDAIAFGAPPDVYRNRIDTLGMVDWMGRHYYRIFRGRAAISQLSNTITTNAGLINAPSSDAPLVRVGDTVKFVYSKNTDNYIVQAVPTDTSLQLNTNNLQAESSTLFSVYRQISNPIMAGTLNIVQGSSTLSIAGKKSAGVCPGDCIVLYTNTAVSVKYTILVVGNTIEIDKPIIESTGSYSYFIYRKGLIGRNVGTFNAQADGTSWIKITNPDLNLIVYTGWTLEIDNVEHKIIDWKPDECLLYLGTAISAGNYTVKIKNNGRVLGFNSRDKYVEDRLVIKLYTDTNATLTNNSTQVITSNIDLTVNARPGDLLKIVNGANNLDCGWGPGVYPIASITNANTLQLTRQLTATENKKFYIIKNY